MKTIGISPKVLAAIAAIGGPGVILLIIALVTGDTELRTIALTLLVGTLPVGGAAAQASPGLVVPRIDVEDATAGLGDRPAS